MFCPKCKCEFPEWVRKCPCCKVALVYGLQPEPEIVEKTISCEGLFDLVRENRGKLKIDLITTDIAKDKRWSFPYMGYGFAWAKKLKGALNNVLVDLTTTEVGMERKWRFPYMGYGYAWVKKLQGHIGGNEVTLTAKKVEMERKWEFPYMGYGYAWIQKMSGECGKKLKIDQIKK